jgi:hypothetical protein
MKTKITILVCMAWLGSLSALWSQCLTNAMPATVCAGTRELTIDGFCTKFTQANVSAVMLVQGATEVIAKTITVSAADKIKATFDIPNTATGKWDVKVTCSAPNHNKLELIAEVEAFGGPAIMSPTALCVGASGAAVSVMGVCTEFGSFADKKVTAVTLKRGTTTITVDNALFITPSSNEILSVIVNVPSDAPAGKYDLEVVTKTQGTLKKTEAIEIGNTPSFSAIPATICPNSTYNGFLTGSCTDFGIFGTKKITKARLTNGTDAYDIPIANVGVFGPTSANCTLQVPATIKAGEYRIHLTFEGSTTELASSNPITVGSNAVTAAGAYCKGKGFDIFASSPCLGIGKRGYVTKATITSGTTVLTATKIDTMAINFVTLKFDSLVTANLGKKWNLTLTTTGGEVKLDDVLSTCEKLGVGMFESLAQSNLFSIAPNPSNGQFRLTFHQQSAQPVMLQVNDLTGRIIWEDSFPSFAPVDVQLPAGLHGIFTLSIRQGEAVQFQKISVQ